MDRRKDKFILDACCGGRMMWFDKKHPNALYCDIRDEDKGFIKGAEFYSVKPDMLQDYRSMDFKDKTFKLVVFDPPHIVTNCKTGILIKKFGNLDEGWKNNIREGFSECWRVLDDYGVLIFKFAQTNKISFKEVLSVIGKTPLFGTKNASTKNTETRWFCFMKIPQEENPNE